MLTARIVFLSMCWWEKRNIAISQAAVQVFKAQIVEYLPLGYRHNHHQRIGHNISKFDISYYLKNVVFDRTMYIESSHNSFLKYKNHDKDEKGLQYFI